MHSGGKCTSPISPDCDLDRTTSLDSLELFLSHSENLLLNLVVIVLESKSSMVTYSRLASSMFNYKKKKPVVATSRRMKDRERPWVTLIMILIEALGQKNRICLSWLSSQCYSMELTGCPSYLEGTTDILKRFFR